MNECLMPDAPCSRRKECAKTWNCEYHGMIVDSYYVLENREYNTIWKKGSLVECIDEYKACKKELRDFNAGDWVITKTTTRKTNYLDIFEQNKSIGGGE